MEQTFNSELTNLKQRLSVANSIDDIRVITLSYKEFLTKYAEHTTDGSGESDVITNIINAIIAFHKNKVKDVPVDKMREMLFNDLILVKFEKGGFSNPGEAIE